MHQVLRELVKRAGRRGTIEELPPIEFRPSAEVGLKALGADQAMLKLRTRGVIRLVGAVSECQLVVEADQLVGFRRGLMHMNPAVAR